MDALGLIALSASGAIGKLTFRSWFVQSPIQLPDSSTVIFLFPPQTGIKSSTSIQLPVTVCTLGNSRKFWYTDNTLETVTFGTNHMVSCSTPSIYYTIDIAFL